MSPIPISKSVNTQATGGLHSLVQLGGGGRDRTRSPTVATDEDNNRLSFMFASSRDASDNVGATNDFPNTMNLNASHSSQLPQAIGTLPAIHQPAGPVNGSAQPIQQGNSHKATKFHPITFHHSHFARQAEKETSPIAVIKQAVLPHPLHPDQVLSQSTSPDELVKSAPYWPEKVALRTSSRVVTRDAKSLALEKDKRRAVVMTTGFNSTSREPYRPLGPPILQLEDLVASSLGIPVRRAGASSPRKPGSFNASRASISTPQTRLDVSSAGSNRQQERENAQASHHDTSAHHQEMYFKLKSSLDQSRARVRSVKFGIPITQMLHNSSSSVENELEKQEKFMASQRGTFYEWTPDRIDREKMHYYLHILTTSPHNSVDPLSNGAGQRNEDSLPTEEIDQPGSSKHERSRSMLQDRRKSTSTGTSRERDPRDMESRELEEALGLPRSEHLSSAQLLEGVRQVIRVNRVKLAQELEEELERSERQRRSVIIHKYKAFEVGVNGIATSDLDRMRHQATTQRLALRKQTLANHPWFSELLRIVLGGGSSSSAGQQTANTTSSQTRKQLSEAERLLLIRVRGLLGDGVELNKAELVRLLKLVPPQTMTNDSIQRVLKFLQGKVGMSEIEYLHALEASGHLSASNRGEAAGQQHAQSSDDSQSLPSQGSGTAVAGGMQSVFLSSRAVVDDGVL